MSTNPWISITVAGSTAGLMVAALSYTAATNVTDMAARGSGLTIQTVGTVASYGTSYFFGNIAGYSVRVISNALAHTAKEKIKYSGMVVAGAAAVAAGAVTALSVTAGQRVIEYSIEYGGEISKAVAQRLAEEYIKHICMGGENDAMLICEEVQEQQQDHDTWLLVIEPKPDILSTELSEAQLSLQDEK